MKTAEVFGKKISFNNKDYSKLLVRFDINNYLDEQIKMNCPLCVTYKHSTNGCNGCPLRKAYNDIYGCLNFTEEILKSKRVSEFLTLCTDSVSYRGRLGKNYVKKIHKFLVENFK